MASDIRIEDDVVSVEGPLKVNEIRAPKNILFISQGLKLLRPGPFDQSLGTALSHSAGDTLVINEGAGYEGGVHMVGTVTIDTLAAKKFAQAQTFTVVDLQTSTLQAQTIQTDLLSAKSGVQTDALSARSITTDSLQAKKIETGLLSAMKGVQTDALSAKTFTTESLTSKKAVVTNDVSVGGKLIALGHGSVDLIALVVQLQAQVKDLQTQVAALKK